MLQASKFGEKKVLMVILKQKLAKSYLYKKKVSKLFLISLRLIYVRKNVSLMIFI